MSTITPGSTTGTANNINNVLRLVDGILAGLPALFQIIEDESTRSGLSTEQIAERAGVKLDAERLRLLDDLMRLGARPPGESS